MYKIIEIANTHGGCQEYMLDLIDTFSSEKINIGIKFQPFKYDRISTQDFEWYPVYEKLFFNSSQWNLFVNKASETKDVWLDIFDDYGIEILRLNSSSVFGVKLQSSVLSNFEVLKDLKDTDISTKYLIINIAGRTIDEIAYWVNYFSEVIIVKELWLEVGFQAYPTEIYDSGLNKIKIIKEKFGKKIVFADHLDGKSEAALWLPIIAAAYGAEVIEKHVMLEDRQTDYDYFSSIFPVQFLGLSKKIDEFDDLNIQPFINQKEYEYLSKTEMKPLLKHKLKKGQNISLSTDLLYRRSSKQSLTTTQLQKYIQDRYILIADKSAGDTIEDKNFKKAKIAAIIACRLKSSRLKSKALLKIGDLTSVELCIKNTLRFKNVDEIVLATSTFEQDNELVKYTYSQDVIFHQGDPEDVIQRYLDVIRLREIDVVIRITADMPYVDNEILQIILKSHFDNGADYSISRKAAVGTNLEIINTEALERVKMYFPYAEYSEYMTWYFQNNPEHFRLNFVDLPQELIRDYRLTLDYQEDLDLFNNINDYFKSRNNDSFRLIDIFEYLDNNPSIAKINNHHTLKYKTDQDLIKLLNEKTKII